MRASQFRFRKFAFAARLGYMSGPVSFSPAGEVDWVEATVNRRKFKGASCRRYARRR